MKSVAIRLGLALSLALLPTLASNAGTDTATLGVSATVVLNCKINVGTLTFANYTSGQTAPVDAVGNLAYNGCQNAALTVELNAGGNSLTGSRGMNNSAGATLRYQLYRESARSSTAGTGTSAITLVAPASGSGTVPIYGRILGGQTVAPGTYSDTVGVTMTF